MAQTPSLSRDCLVLCACRGKEYKVRDAIAAAFYRGDLEPLWKEFLCNVQADQQAKESELEPDYDAVDEMAERFRYEHDLITAEETERWLEQRGVTLEDFSDYFARRHWRGALEEDIAPNGPEFVSAPAELRDLFTAELMFDGQLEVLTKHLKRRLAVHAATGGDGIDPKEIATERRQFLERNKIQTSKLGSWLNQIGRNEDWLEETALMEVLYRHSCESVLNSQARKKQLAILRMPLTRFEAEVIEVESLDAAKEALFCIREDAMSMEEVASEARYPHRRISFRHEDVPTEWQQKFWSVNAGDLLEPLPRGDSFELYRITHKSEPDLSDATVQERIDELLLEQHFAELVGDHVQVRLEIAAQTQ